MLHGSSRYGREDEADMDSSVFVKYNRMLQGKKTGRGQKRDMLTIKFLKKFIHYAKHRIQPELTDEVVFDQVELHLLMCFYFVVLNFVLVSCTIISLHFRIQWTTYSL